MTARGLLCFGATASMLCSAARAETEPEPGLQELFRTHSYTIERTDDGELTGPGADFLTDQSANVQFFCIGEPHNVHQIPLFVTALFEHLQDRLGFHYLAIEQGPLITSRLGRLAQTQDNREIRRFAKKRRKALHFRTVEEVEMMADVARASKGAITGVWGLDRVLDPVFLREYLAGPEGSADPDAGFLEDRGEWSAKNLAMYGAPRGSEDWLAADQHREDGFKTGFRYYHDRATLADGAPPRILFRFGHVHLRRSVGGDDATLGHYLGQYAEENGLGTTLILNIQLINRPGRYWSLTEYPDYEALARVGDPTKWILVDLRPARTALSAGERSANDALRRFVVDFDVVLLLGGGSKGRKL